MFGLPVAELVALLAQLRTTFLTTPKVHLFKALANPLGPGTVLGDFTEADYTGYAAQTAAFLAAFVNGSGQAESDSPNLLFQPTGTAVVNTVLGFYVTDSASAVLLWAGSFPTPVSLAGPTTGLPLVIQFILDPQGA